MSAFNALLDRFGRWIARRASDGSSGYEPYLSSRPDFIARFIQPGDVLLIEGGRSKISSAIKYLTQSTWSHAALYIGEALEQNDPEGRPLTLIEAEIGDGIVASPLEKYASFNARICRPVGLTPEDRQKVIAYAISKLGGQYDLRNIFDLVRFLLPNPPVPQRFRRRMLALGSGEPTRAICSTLIAAAFESVRYPILPRIEIQSDSGVQGSGVRNPGAGVPDSMSRARRREVLHIRHSSLYTPRDFDVSPYFDIVKPTVELGFDYKTLEWASENEPG
ncbi:MAG: lipo-like protein [Rhizobiales bacterium PAR1]|nr:MAG: lipo-like protein [Rhizobiales bacterium PAR1]